MAYTPFTRHLNNDILSAYKNPQASGATGRAVVAGLGAPAARRALRQGATLPSATSSTAAVEALGQGGGLSTVIDSPEPGQGGQGPMEGGAAPMGLGSSSSSMESTRGPGRDVSARVEMSEGAKDILGKLSSSSALNFGKNYAKYGGLVNPVELAMGSIFQAVPGVGLGVGLGALNKLGGDIINENRQEDRDTALQAVIDNTTDEDFATGRLGKLAEAMAPPERVDSVTDAIADLLGINDIFCPDINSDVAVDTTGVQAYDAAVSAKAPHTAKVKAMDENQSIHNQMLSSLHNRGSSLPGHTVSNASAMAAARDLGKGQGLAVSGERDAEPGAGNRPGQQRHGRPGRRREKQRSKQWPGHRSRQQRHRRNERRRRLDHLLGALPPGPHDEARAYARVQAFAAAPLAHHPAPATTSGRGPWCAP